MRIINKIVFVIAGLSLAPVLVHATGEVNQRLENQDKRIDNGVKNKTLTKKQAHHLRKKDKEIKGEEKAMRKEDNGKLTSGDKKLLNTQENQVSKQIYTEKHN